MGTVQKGMPHKCYHGKTGRVYNVTEQAAGIVISKQVKGRILAKRIKVRVEHIKPSKSQDSFQKQVKEKDQKKKEAKEKGARRYKEVTNALAIKEFIIVQTSREENGACGIQLSFIALLFLSPSSSWKRLFSRSELSSTSNPPGTDPSLCSLIQTQDLDLIWSHCLLQETASS
ncbi:hypothetical protein CB1_000602016 [Camelus ferus]|nr:hypothetical protein CB1_000602016 [Camelus ferus]